MSETRVARIYKLDTPTKMKTLAMVARGEQTATILRILNDEHGVNYTRDDLSQLKRTNRDTINEMKQMILEAEASEAEQVRVKALRQLSRRLDKASEDEVEIHELDRQYRDGEIELNEYKRLKTGLLKLSVNELTSITKDMHTQSGGKRSTNALPGTPAASDNTPDPKWVEALMTAVQRGDTIAMQQLVITPNA